MKTTLGDIRKIQPVEPIDFSKVFSVKLNKTALSFLARHRISTVRELLATSVSQENTKTWRSLAGLREALKKNGYDPDANRFLITTI